MRLADYIVSLNSRHLSGNATEHSYRGDLQRYLEEVLSGVDVTNEPKRIDCGAPDYILSRGEIPVGYIEAQDVGKALDDKSFREPVALRVLLERQTRVGCALDLDGRLMATPIHGLALDSCIEGVAVEFDVPPAK